MIDFFRLREVLDYDPETGVFVWFQCSRKPFLVGKPAGKIMPNGYRVIKIDGRGYYAHRLAWLYVYSYWPTLQIDHINRDRSDNRIENLRDVTQSINQRNRGAFSWARLNA